MAFAIVRGSCSVPDSRLVSSVSVRSRGVFATYGGTVPLSAVPSIVSRESRVLSSDAGSVPESAERPERPTR